MILVIDNYDSFTFNLDQYLRELSREVRVVRNDQIDVEGIRRQHPRAIVLSPGPGRPEDAGVCSRIVSELGGEFPILGVCLGHQVIASVFGAVVSRADRLMHGKTSPIQHDGRTIFAGLPNPFEAMRYHSLLVEAASLPACFEVSGWTQESEIMAIRHRSQPIEGVQFHPESFLTPAGKNLLRNFVSLHVDRNQHTAQ